MSVFVNIKFLPATQCRISSANHLLRNYVLQKTMQVVGNLPTKQRQLFSDFFIIDLKWKIKISVDLTKGIEN